MYQLQANKAPLFVFAGKSMYPNAQSCCVLRLGQKTPLVFQSCCLSEKGQAPLQILLAVRHYRAIKTFHWDAISRLKRTTFCYGCLARPVLQSSSHCLETNKALSWPGIGSIIHSTSMIMEEIYKEEKQDGQRGSQHNKGDMTCTTVSSLLREP